MHTDKLLSLQDQHRKAMEIKDIQQSKLQEWSGKVKDMETKALQKGIDSDILKMIERKQDILTSDGKIREGLLEQHLIQKEILKKQKRILITHSETNKKKQTMELKEMKKECEHLKKDNIQFK